MPLTLVLCLLLVGKVETFGLELAVDEGSSEASTVHVRVRRSVNRPNSQRDLQDLLGLCVATGLAVSGDVLLVGASSLSISAQSTV